MFKLTIEDEEGKTTVVPIIRDEMTIGRDEGNTIRLTERNVSRRHARLMRQNGAIFVEDLKSFTGVRVNGNRIAGLTAVNEGDQLQIGDYKIKVKSDRPSDPAVERSTRAAPPPLNGSEPAATPPVASLGRATGAQQPNTALTSLGRAVTPRPHTSHGIPDLLPVPDPIEAQPTIPLRMLSEIDPAHPDAPPATPARLVVLTTELAGKEFPLDRASLVIGRTNENDVVLNHRSISRHHAKIVQDRDHFTIVDLQSANGVRVNGEDYERIELHAGDVVELGHVRLRFVGPAEHYVFDPLSRSNRGRSKVVFALMGIGLAAGSAVILQRTLATHGDGAVASLAARATGQPPPAPATPAAVGATTPVMAVAPAVPPPAVPSELLAQATAQAKTESWDASLATLVTLATILDRLTGSNDGGPPAEATVALKKQADDLRQRVEIERRSAVAFAKFDESFQQKNYAASVDWFGELPDASMYKARARPKFEEARLGLVAQYLVVAEKLRQAGRCADLREEVALVNKLDPRNAVATEKLRQCRPHLDGAVTVAATTRLASSRQAATRADGPPLRRASSPANRESAKGAPALALASRRSSIEPAASVVVDADAGDADTLLKQARDAWLRQQCGLAIDLSRKAIKARPGMGDAYQVIAVCSCSLKDAEGASRAYGKLDDKSRTLVRTLCQRNGITVGVE